MTSLRSHEGYYLVDHREAPGVPDAITVASGLPAGSLMAGSIFESAAFTCPYCECVVVLNPDRSRPRNYDKATDHLICDGCAALRAVGQLGLPIKVLADIIRNEAARVPVTTEAFQSPVIQADSPPPAPPEPQLIIP